MLPNREMSELMDTYSGYLPQISYMYVKDWATAEDLVQESFIKFFRSQGEFREESSLKTYLTRITIDTCHNYLRSWKNKKHVLSQLLLGKAASGKEGMELTRHVMQLPLIYREAILLFYYEDYTIAAIAGLLGLSENTVKIRLRRVRSMLQ